MAEITKQQVIDFIANMSVLDLSELIKELEGKFGVSASAPMMAMMPGAGAAAAAPEAEEKTEFNVVLITSGEKKIQVIKEVRAITGLGLKEAKELVDGAPSTVKEGVSKEEAQDIKTKIEGAGGQVEIK
jgi:large subunit ribosomal protein L7/L12